MVLSTKKYVDKDVELSQMLRAVAHPARLMIIRKIAAYNSCVEGQVVNIDQLAKATVVEHLRALKKAGVIQGKIFGSKCNYCINPRFVATLNSSFLEFQENFQQGQKIERSCASDS